MKWILVLSIIPVMVMVSACVPTESPYRAVYDEFIDSEHELAERQHLLTDIHAMQERIDEAFRQEQTNIAAGLWEEAKARFKLNVLEVLLVVVVLNMIIVLMYVMIYGSPLGYVIRFNALRSLRRKRRIVLENTVSYFETAQAIAEKLPGTVTQPKIVPFPTAAYRSRRGWRRLSLKAVLRRSSKRRRSG
ncbi:MAG: hypothetical protein IAE80_19440 [Anaerolinea sp.]|nr:hypothetical protein [Anaerolinea sp.]